MPGSKAHGTCEKSRTEDVLIHDDINFSDLLLSESTLKGLKSYGFEKPSPIQREAIPLGKCGFDLIVQAKSGTGKTCVFTVTALEMVKTEIEKLQVLILSPTREISVQIKDVILAIGKDLQKLKVEAFIGGTPLEIDKKKLQKCQIAVGAPGRVKHLMSEGMMKTEAVRLFILDEADKLMEDNFRKDISFIFLRLPEVKQMIAASATFPPLLEDFVTRYMNNPMRVSPGKDIFLLGIRQFVSIVPSHPSVLIQIKNKMAELLRILSVVPFKQCLVFSNYQSRAESITNELNKAGWPSAYISGSQNQTIRLKAMSSLKEFRCRVLLSTDLTSRGIDAENVNLIINLDLPYDGATYMHRIGRAGRYGTYGLAITIVQNGPEMDQFRKMLNSIGNGNFPVFLFPKKKLEFNIWKSKDEDFEKVSSIEGEYKYLKIKERAEKEVKNSSLEERKEEVKHKAQKNLFGFELAVPENPKVETYETLIKLVSEFKNASKAVKIEEKVFNYKDFFLEMKSFVIYLEKQEWEKYKANLMQSYTQFKVEKETELEFSESDANSEKEENHSWEEYHKEKKFEIEDDEEEDYYNNKFRSCSCEEIQDEYLQEWYSIWYAQVSVVRQYVSCLKNLFYWQELLLFSSKIKR